MVPFILVAALAGAQESAPPPAPVEQAVIEHRCLGIRMTTEVAGDAYHNCLTAQLAGLRADFGPNLAALTLAERRKLDAQCSRIRAVEGRERYVACLSDRLAALRAARTDGQPGSTPALVPLPPPAGAEFPAAAPAVASASSPAERTSGMFVVLGIALILAGGAGGGALLRSRRRRGPAQCRACGATFDHAGDLCPACRHEAAEERRRAAAERAHQARVIGS